MHSDRGGADRNEQGFTLFETVAALTVLSIAVVALFSAHTAAIRGTTAAEDYGKARLIAESLLADTTTGWGFPLKSATGGTDKFTWTIAIEDGGGVTKAIDPKTGWRLAQVRVDVAWQPARSVSLFSYKLIKARIEQ